MEEAIATGVDQFAESSSEPRIQRVNKISSGSLDAFVVEDAVPSNPIVPPTSATGVWRWATPIVSNAFFLLIAICINLLGLLVYPFRYPPLSNLLPFNALRVGRRIAKEMFGLELTLSHQWFAPTVLHITTDSQLPMEELFKPGRQPGSGGTLKLPHRIIIIANHQVYPDFVFIWLFTYLAKVHGAMMILLKDAFKNVPIVGWGMQFFDFIFLRRRWEADREEITRRLNLIKSDWERKDPLTVLIFPEGTILTENTRNAMTSYAKKENITIPLPKHCLLPRVTGIQHILQELSDGDVEYLYDITIGFEGVGPDTYPNEVYTLRSVYMLGAAPPGIHLHVRRWHIATEVPLIDGTDKFAVWLRERWMEKDEVLDRFYKTGSMSDAKTVEERTANTVIRPVAAHNLLLEMIPVVLVLVVYAIILRFICSLIW
ncbi:acyltransferase-domain-containing protein [Syncephalis fuscata]|nr:acyltransferase-domain-containing protein [Syncephalis fuscata]